MFDGARTRSVKIIKSDSSDIEEFQQEMFGPIVFLIATESTEALLISLIIIFIKYI